MDSFRFVEVSQSAAREQNYWPSIVIPKRAIDAEIERLASAPRPAHGRRGSLVVHPLAQAPGLGLAPGIDVTINVLKPGEESAPIARNSTLVDMCIRGAGHAHIGPKSFTVEPNDVWNTPSMAAFRYRNDGNDLFVRLSYSNAPLLEKLEVHYVDEQPKLATLASEASQDRSSPQRARDLAEAIEIDADGAKLLGYEYLIDIDVVESKALHWPWRRVNQELRRVYERDTSYTGRHLYVLYNPATERRIGATHSFFATLAWYPPNKIDQPHRHTSAAINYYFQGHGRSTVIGERFEWEAGDLHLSAPGWAVHNHSSRHQGFCALTIQDHPLHIAMESLLWQETLKSPIRKLGTDHGFETNLAGLVGAA